MTAPGHSRNLFQDFDFDGQQSDISVDSDVNLDPDLNDFDGENDLDLPVDNTDITLGGGGDNHEEGNDGWKLDCTEAGATVLPFINDSGPTNILDLDARPIEYFLQLVPETFFQTLAEETNLYAVQRNDRRKRPTATPTHDTPTPVPNAPAPSTNAGAASPTPDTPAQPTSTFKPTSAEEIKSFLAIHIYMGIVTLPNYRLYWSSDPTFNQQFVSNLMTKNRYEDLTTNFHMNDSTKNPPRGTEGHDPIHKVRPILDLVQKTWPENFKPGRDVCVDEAMIPFKGRCAFRQYLPAKPTKWGLKVWALCDSETYYMINMNLYTGRHNDLGNDGDALGERVVKKLMQPYLLCRHVVYMDNYFTSLPLLSYLHENETYGCGTVRTNRRGLPQRIKDPKVVRKSGDIFRMCKDNVQAIAWFDRKKVTILTTAHTSVDHEVSRRSGPGTTREYARPLAIEAYSKNFNGVDKNDQLRSYYSMSAKAFKWWKYILWFCLDVSLINAYILYLNAPGGPRPKKMSHLDFLICIMKDLGALSTELPTYRKKCGIVHNFSDCMHVPISLKIVPIFSVLSLFGFLINTLCEPSVT